MRNDRQHIRCSVAIKQTRREVPYSCIGYYVCAVYAEIVRTELYGLATEEESEGLTLVWSSILETE